MCIFGCQQSACVFLLFKAIQTCSIFGLFDVLEKNAGAKI